MPSVKEQKRHGAKSSSRQNRSEVPEVVINRLPQYVRILNRLLEDGIQVVSSQQLGEKLQVTPAQIRKDLSYFGPDPEASHDEPRGAQRRGSRAAPTPEHG